MLIPPSAEPPKDQYQPFSTITLNSLHHALGDSSLSLSSLQIDSLIKSYDALSTFPDVSPALQSLANEKNITPVIFSNGTESMVYNSVYSSPSLSPHAHVFRDIITVEQVEKFKPDPSAYYHLAEKMGKGRDEKSMGEMWLVSGNPFDVVGARAVGMKAAWVDRVGKGWTDRLLNGEKARPTIVVAGLGEAVEGVRGLSGG